MFNGTDDSSEISWTTIVSLVVTIFTLLLCLLGAVFNLISIIVFLQAHFRHLSINILLAALGAADCLLLLLSSVVFASGPLIDYFRMNRILLLLHSYSAAWVYPIANMFHCCSIWLLLAITFERWLAICSPLDVSFYCTRPRAIASIIIISVSSVLYNLVRFWEYRIVDGRWLDLGLRANQHYFLWYSTVSTFLLLYVLPLFIHIYCYFKVSRQLVLARRIRRQLTRSQMSDHRTSKMLGFIVLGFILCYSMSLLLNVLESIDPETFRTPFGALVSDLNNTLVVLNASSSPLFYYKFSSRYRRTLKHLLCRRDDAEGQVAAVMLESLRTSTSIRQSRRMKFGGSYRAVSQGTSETASPSRRSFSMRNRALTESEVDRRRYRGQLCEMHMGAIQESEFKGAHCNTSL